MYLAERRQKWCLTKFILRTFSTITWGPVLVTVYMLCGMIFNRQLHIFQILFKEGECIRYSQHGRVDLQRSHPTSISVTLRAHFLMYSLKNCSVEREASGINYCLNWSNRIVLDLVIIQTVMCLCSYGSVRRHYLLWKIWNLSFGFV